VISANCPSCGSQIVFRSAATITVVCSACSSAVYRTDQSLVDLGKVSSVARDLSPLQVGASGNHGGRAFSIVGVLRKGRDRVRWNEWFIDYHDGSYGWLSDGNAEFQIFAHKPISARLPDPQGLPANSRFDAGGHRWIVTERGFANLLAAEGELPFKVGPDESFHYVDMKSTAGLAGTLDKDAWGNVLLWVGDVVDLQALQMEGLRPFTGWTDPAFMGYRGPETEAVRSLQCPKCRAPLVLRDPGSVARVICVYCGSELGASEHGGGIALAILEAQSNPPFRPTIPLGSIGSIRGMKWQTIGAQIRFVRSEGVDYPWTEYLLHNPYRGYAWLVEDDDGHWSYVRKLPFVPQHNQRIAVWNDRNFKSFSAGSAQVRSVLGEFYWEIHSGDRAHVADYVAPPAMLSMEAANSEMTWSVGAYLSHTEVKSAFGVEKIRRPRGVAPHQPNPYEAKSVKNLAALGTIALVATFAVMWLAATVLLPRKELLEEAWIVPSRTEQLFLSKEFVVPGGLRRDVTIRAMTAVKPVAATVHLSLIDLDSGRAWLPKVRRKTGGGQTQVHGVVQRPAGGRHAVRVELATPPGGSGSIRGETVTLRVILRDPWRMPIWLAAGFILFAMIFRTLASNRFESTRWSQSDFAEQGVLQMLAAGVVASMELMDE